MARPITWRNVNSASAAPAVDMLESAGKSINQGFAGFSDMLDEAQQVRTDNRDNQIENNNQQVRDYLQGIGSAEEMARVKESGDFRKLLSGFGNMVDREEFQGAGRERLTTLRQQESADYNHGQTTLKRDQAPLVREAKLAIANDDDETFQTIMDNNPDLLNAPDLMNQFTETERARLVQGREDREHDQNKLFRNLVSRFKGASSEQGDTQSVQAFEAAAIERGLDPSRIGQGVEILQQGFDRNGKLYGDDKREYEGIQQNLAKDYGIGRSAFKNYDTTDPIKASADLVQDFTTTDEDGNQLLFGMTDDNDRAAITREISDYMMNGVTVTLEGGEEVNVPITADVARLALQGVKGGWSGDSTFKKRVTQLVRDGGLRDDFENFRQYQAELSNLEANKMKIALGEYQRSSPQQQGSAQPSGSNQPEQEQQPQNAPIPPMLARKPESPVPTDVASSINYLRDRGVIPGPAPSEQPQQPSANDQSSVPVLDRKLGPYINQGLSAVGNAAGNAVDYVGNRVTQNRTNTLRELARDPSGMPKGPFMRWIRGKSDVLRSMTTIELNQLRDAYGDDVINEALGKGK